MMRHEALLMFVLLALGCPFRAGRVLMEEYSAGFSDVFQ